MYRNRKRKHILETLEKLDRQIKKEQLEIKNHPNPPNQHDTTHNDPVSTTSTPSIQLGLTYRSIRIGSYKVLKSKEMVSFSMIIIAELIYDHSYFRCILLKTLFV